MTILGVFGCTSLIVMGFGFQTSINNTVKKQYEETRN